MKNKQTILTVDDQFASHLGLGQDFVSLIPNFQKSCDWKIPKEQYSLVTKEIISVSNQLSEVFAERYFRPHFPYKKEALVCFFNGFGGLLSFFIGDRLIRVNKLLANSGNKSFQLPAVEVVYDNSWSHPHVFYNLIEQKPEFNQWMINLIFSDWVESDVQLGKKSGLSRSLYFENHLPKEEKRKKNQLDPVAFAQKVLRKVWDGRRPGFQKITLPALIQSIYKIFRRSLMMKTRRLLYQISSFGKDVPWDGLGPIPDPQYDHWRFIWPMGRLCFYGQDKITDQKLNIPIQLQRTDILMMTDEIAKAFENLLVAVDGKCLVEQKHLKNIAKVFMHLAPRCFVEDLPAHAERYLKIFKPFVGRSYFSGGTYASYPCAFRMFACRELGVEVISTQHSAWGGYFANGPLVTEFLIKGADRYITFGWDQKPADGSGWLKEAVPLSAPLTSKMYQQAKPFQKKPFHRRVLLCPGFIYRFPSIYNSALRVDNIQAWSAIMKDIVHRLCENGIEVDILMYNDVMAGNMKALLSDWLAGNESRAKEYPSHDVKVRYILNGPEFRDKYDAVVWDLMAGGFVESVATNIPTFALWNSEIHQYTREGRPVVEALMDEGILFDNGNKLIKGLEKFYQEPEKFLYRNNSNLRLFFDSFVKIDENWLAEWNRFFKSLP